MHLNFGLKCVRITWDGLRSPVSLSGVRFDYKSPRHGFVKQVPERNPRNHFPNLMTSPAADSQPNVSSKTTEFMEELLVRFRNSSIAERVWQDILSREQRKALGDHLQKAWETHSGTIGILCSVWQCPPWEAAIRLCEEFGMYDRPMLRRLRNELGLPSDSQIRSPVLDKPDWQRDKRELLFGGQVIRTVRSTTVGKNIVRILDVFQEENWPEHIDDPLSPAGKRKGISSPDKQQLREAIHSLNTGLSKITFHGDGTGQGVRWKPQS